MLCSLCAEVDLSHRPPAYQTGALTRLSYPRIVFLFK